MPFVFDRFRQADGTTTRTHGGLGLGLSIVRYLVEMHGGSVQAESEGAGKGSVFIINLPVAAVLERSAEAQHEDGNDLETESNAGLLKDLRILVVDDENDSLLLLKTIIESCGGEAKAVSSAAEALEALDNFDPHILISDIGMPVEDGYTLIKKIRALQSGKADIPAIALTAYAGQADQTRALESGFQMHIAKPVAYSELIAAIEAVAGLKK